MSEETPEKETRHGKAEVQKFISECLDLIAKNKSRIEVINHLKNTHNVNQNMAYKWYKEAADQLEEDNAVKVKEIRNMRISALRRDIEEAYTNYLSESESHIKVKWFEVYSKLKQQLDAYYPNALKPETEKEELKVEISFNKINRLSEDDN